MNASLIQWAIRNRVSQSALEELKDLWGLDPMAPALYPKDASEAYVQSLVRLEAASAGVKLWRNNVGVLVDATGRPVRYGLANDSKRLNESVKSGDLIGWRRLVITSSHVGSVVAQFVSRECKPPTWQYTGTDREVAQLKWITAVSVDGGDAQFVTGKGTL